MSDRSHEFSIILAVVLATIGAIVALLVGIAYVASTSPVAMSLLVVLGITGVLIHEYLMHRARLHFTDQVSQIVQAITRRVVVDDDVQPLPQLPEPTTWTRDGNTLVNRKVVIDDAGAILRAHNAGLPTRRADIERILQTTDHARVQRAEDALCEWGYLSEGRAGAARKWVDPAPDDDAEF